MLCRILRILGQVVSPLVVAAAPGQDIPGLPAGILQTNDADFGRGPLAGVAAGLAALEGRADAAFLSACDAPLLRAGFVHRLIQLLGHHEVCMPKSDGHLYPLTAVYRVRILGKIKDLLAERSEGPSAVVNRVDCRIVIPAEYADIDEDSESLWNVNTPADYDKLLEHLQRRRR